MFWISVLTSVNHRKMASKNYAQNLQNRVISNDFEKLSDNPTDYTYKCLINESCVKPISGRKKSNLVAHARTHKDFFREKYEVDGMELKNMARTRLDFIQHCTELVTANHFLFSTNLDFWKWTNTNCKI